MDSEAENRGDINKGDEEHMLFFLCAKYSLFLSILGKFTGKNTFYCSLW